MTGKLCDQTTETKSLTALLWETVTPNIYHFCFFLLETFKFYTINNFTLTKAEIKKKKMMCLNMLIHKWHLHRAMI